MAYIPRHDTGIRQRYKRVQNNYELTQGTDGNQQLYRGGYPDVQHHGVQKSRPGLALFYFIDTGSFGRASFAAARFTVCTRCSNASEYDGVSSLESRIQEEIAGHGYGSGRLGTGNRSSKLVMEFRTAAPSSSSSCPNIKNSSCVSST